MINVRVSAKDDDNFSYEGTVIKFDDSLHDGVVHMSSGWLAGLTEDGSGWSREVDVPAPSGTRWMITIGAWEGLNMPGYGVDVFAGLYATPAQFVVSITSQGAKAESFRFVSKVSVGTIGADYSEENYFPSIVPDPLTGLT